MSDKIAKKHLLPATERKDSKNPTKFKKAESILADIYCDFANGLTRSEIKSKLMNGLYEAQKGTGIKDAMACGYLRATEERIQQDFDNSRGEMANRIALNYLTIFQDALKEGDRLNANKALDGLSKLMGYGTVTNAIQINGSKDGGVMINFGFHSNNDN